MVSSVYLGVPDLEVLDTRSGYLRLAMGIWRCKWQALCIWRYTKRIWRCKILAVAMRIWRFTGGKQ